MHYRRKRRPGAGPKGDGRLCAIPATGRDGATSVTHWIIDQSQLIRLLRRHHANSADELPVELLNLIQSSSRSTTSIPSTHAHSSSISALNSPALSRMLANSALRASESSALPCSVALRAPCHRMIAASFVGERGRTPSATQVPGTYIGTRRVPGHQVRLPGLPVPTKTLFWATNYRPGSSGGATSFVLDATF